MYPVFIFFKKKVKNRPLEKMCLPAGNERLNSYYVDL